jgi:hypothetical protein
VSKINSLRGFCSSSSNTQIFEQMETSLDNVTSMIIDVKDLVVFLSNYPRIYRQPYSMHLLLGNCMLGCQIEGELVINFLLQTQHYGSENLEVLPIVGLGKVGKSTPCYLLTPERAVTDEHDLVHKLLIVGAPTGQTDMCRRSDWCATSATCTRNPLPGRDPIGERVSWVDLASTSHLDPPPCIAGMKGDKKLGFGKES